MKKGKKILAFALALLLVFVEFQLPGYAAATSTETTTKAAQVTNEVLAQDDDSMDYDVSKLAVTSGSEKEEIWTWSLSEDGVLKISGTGHIDGTWPEDFPWYSERGNITEIIIANGITSIGSWAFYECNSMTSVKLPDSVTHIGEYAFAYCESLLSVKLPDSLITIGEGAFNNCINLKKIQIPESVTEIKNYAFLGCSSLTEINIPSKITTIAASTFEGCSGLTGVFEIPSNVTTIGMHAFYECTGINHLVFSENLVKFGDEEYSSDGSPFYKMTGVTTLTFKGINVPTGVKNPFSSLSNLKTIYVPEAAYDSYVEKFSSMIPKTVEILSILPEESEPVLTGIEIVTLPTKTDYLPGETFDQAGLVVNAVYNNHRKELLKISDYVISGFKSDVFGKQTITVTYGRFTTTFEVTVLTTTCGTNATWNLSSDGVLTISGTGEMTDYTYNEFAPWYNQRSNIKEIVVHEGITSIGEYAFYNCNKMTSTKLPDSVIRIGQYAFANCSLLKEINIPPKVTVIEELTFDLCKSLTGLFEIPSNVTTIKRRALEGCTGITHLVLGENLTKIGDEKNFWQESPFSAMTCVTTLTFRGLTVPTGVKDPFEEMFRLKTIYVPEEVLEAYKDAYKFYVDSSVEFLPITGTEKTTGIEIVSLPNKTVYNLDEELDVTGLKVNVVRADGSKVLLAENSYQISGYNSNIRGKQSITVSYGTYTATFDVIVIIPDAEPLTGTCGPNLTWILTSDGILTISGSGKMTEFEVFLDVPWYNEKHYLKEVILEDGVTSIGSSAFYGCTNMKSIEIPSSVTSIGNSAFYECTSIESVKLPSNVTSIGTNAFYKCTSIESVEIPSNVTSIEAYTFNGCVNIKSIEIPSGVTHIGSSAFKGCSSLISVEIPDSVTDMGNSVFYNCTELSYAKLSANIKRIENRMFQGCENLENIEIPVGVTSIGEFAFYTCKGLSGTLHIPDSVREIQSYAFSLCGNTGQLVIPNGVITIGQQAFAQCKFTSIELPESVSNVGKSAFANCNQVTELIFKRLTVPVNDLSFKWMNNLKKVYVPAESYDTYVKELSSQFGNAVEFIAISNETDVFMTDIEIVSLPKKLSYALNEKLDLEGLVVNAVYNDGSKIELKASDYNMVGYDEKVAKEQTITIVYGNYSKEFNVTVYIGYGSVGENLTWLLDGEGTLTISGTGEIGNSNHPWFTLTSYIRNLVLEEGITAIGDYAFLNCYNLTGKLELPSSVTRIGTKAFSACHNITGELELPSSVIQIGDYAFLGCTNLTSVKFNSGAVEILTAPFMDCTGLVEMTFVEKNVPIVQDNFYDEAGNYCESSFSRMLGLKRICVPASALNDYVVTFAGLVDESVEFVPIPDEGEHIPTIEVSERVQGIINNMSLRDKITQMIMVDFKYWDMDVTDNVSKTGFTVMNSQVQKIVEDYNFGSIIYGDQNLVETEKAYKLSMALQAAATKNGGIPLFLSVDQEGGMIYRLVTGCALPGNMALGATFDTNNAYKAGMIIGSELSVLGINTNLAPVVDVHNNPNKPVAGLRAYSDDAAVVGEMAVASISGMANYNVIGCARNFPGQGEAETNTEYGLSIVDKSYEELRSIELKPYEAVIEKGIEMIMASHVLYPQLEFNKIISNKTGKAESLPATMSDDILTKLLKEDMEFEGIVVTDAMNVAGIVSKWEQTQAVKVAISAGADMISMPCSLHSEADLVNLDEIINGVVEAVENGEISEDRINDACARILNVKEKRGILDYDAKNYSLENALETVGSEENRQLEREIAAAAVTVIRNGYSAEDTSDDILPLELTENSKVLMLCPYNNERAQMIMGWNRAVEAGIVPEGAEVDYYRFSKDGITNNAGLQEKLEWADVVIINSEVSSVARMSYKHWLSALPNEVVTYCRVNGKLSVIVSVGIPYDVQLYPNADAIVAVYGANGSEVDVEDALGGATGSEMAYGPNIIAAVEVILGTYGAQGNLPIDIPAFDDFRNIYTEKIVYKRGYGITYESKIQIPEEPIVPSIISNFTAAEDDTGIYLTWSMAEEETTDVYCIYRKAGNEEEFSLLTEIKGREILSYVDKAVEKGVIYEYFITGKNVEGMEGKPSQIVSEQMIPDIEKPSVTEVFKDVSNGGWFLEAVQYVYDNGIMSGSNGLFNPTNNITRAQVVSTLYKLAGSPKVTDFSAVEDMVDVKAGQWYTDAVCWAYSVGVAAGNQTTKKFNIINPVTRQQLATFFYKYAELKGFDTETRGDYSDLVGADQVASYAADTMKWAYGTGLITGSATTANGVTVYDLKPTGTATRAQMAAILKNFCENNNI